MELTKLEHSQTLNPGLIWYLNLMECPLKSCPPTLSLFVLRFFSFSFIVQICVCVFFSTCFCFSFCFFLSFFMFFKAVFHLSQTFFISLTFSNFSHTLSGVTISLRALENDFPQYQADSEIKHMFCLFCVSRFRSLVSHFSFVSIFHLCSSCFHCSISYHFRAFVFFMFFFIFHAPYLPTRKVFSSFFLFFGPCGDYSFCGIVEIHVFGGYYLVTTRDVLRFALATSDSFQTKSASVFVFGSHSVNCASFV